MITKSVTEARRELSALIELARKGEDVVIIRDSRPVASLRPIDASDLQLAPEVSDAQARRLWEMTAAGSGKSFRSAKTAVGYLRKAAARKP